jgi:TolB-like protein/Tfp pilus assembly protein PilF
MKAFLEELKNRRVFRVAIAYAIIASGTIQVIGTVLPIFHVRDWVQQVFVVLVGLGFPVALMLSWVFDLTSQGIVRTAAGSDRALNRSRAISLAVIGLLIGGAGIAGYWLWHPWTNDSNAISAADSNAGIPEKSIAVLPFANQSEEKANAFFTEGVQDEILNDLAKIADLKVISRTSVMQYQSGTNRNLREIGRQLGVAYVLEGSVRRDANRIRVTVQLVDARTDSTRWSEQYDSDLADVFQIQNTIAEKIVQQLRAELSSQEKENIETRPTNDMAAYDLFLQARNIVDTYLDVNDPGASLHQAAVLLDRAIQIDPNFVLAYCYKARAHDLLYFLDLDLNAAQCEAAHEAVQTASRLAPNSAEVHLAAADHAFRCRRDYVAAQNALAAARPGLPNSLPFFVISGYIHRRQNHWDQAENEFAKAVRIDPRNPNAVNLLADTYVLERRFSDAIATYDRAIDAGLQNPIIFVRKAAVQFAETGDTSYVRAALAAAPPDLDVGGGETPIRILVALIDRNYDAAQKALAASPRKDFQEADFSFYYPREWYEAIIARAAGNTDKMLAAFTDARSTFEERLNSKPDDARTLAVMAQVDAGLGRKEQAITEARHSVELMPMSRDAYDAPLVLEGLARVYTWTGEKDLAIDTLQKLLSVPGYLTVAYLKQDPVWQPLRDHPRFQSLVSRGDSSVRSPAPTSGRKNP